MAEQRYTIHEQLGAGGNGAVYRAYDTQLKRWVAIKRLLSASEAVSDDPNALELRREADTLASLRNANIVTIFDVATDAEGLFMVMELLEGPDLADAIAHGPLMPDDFKQLAEQTLEALLAAHNLRILHRDIKPENIKVERLAGGRLQAKIIDFGLARTGIAARKQTEDQEGSVMGSIYYMAPEQLSREPTDTRTDLYALGCVFYETLAGRKPFDGKTVNEVIDKHLDHDVVPLGQICPHLPQWLTFWVMRLMACKPADRPVSAQQAIEEFRAWEKLPPAPNMMPWMPMGYAPPAYAPAPMPVYTGQVPVHTTGYFPTAAVPHITSSSVPVQAAPQAQTASAPVAVPVARPVGPTPQRPAPTTKAAPATPKSKMPMIIGGAVVVLAAVGFVFFKGSGKKNAGGGSGGSLFSSFDPGPVHEELYPNDRSFPIPENMRVVHVLPRVGTRSYVKDGSGKPTSTVAKDFSGDSPVAMLSDLTARGGNTPFVSRDFNPAASPVRTAWKTDDNAVKDGRVALDFKSRGGTPVSMKLHKPEVTKDTFPFGKPPPQPLKGGLTLTLVFQADAQALPARVLRLTGEGGKPSVTLRVLPDKSVEAECVGASGSTKLTSSGVEATRPCIASVIWDPETNEVQLRTRDHRGLSNKVVAKLDAPKTPLYDLELGSGDAKQAFGGKLAELVLFATAQRDDQAALLDKDLREHYFASPKPGALNPQKNKLLADWGVGQERDIFNGHDLTGWELNPKWWFVKDGAITNQADPEAQSGGSVWAYWKDGTVGDFELRAKVKLSYGGAGVQYRGNIKGLDVNGPLLQGYQLDLDSDSKKKDRFGALVETDGRGDLGKVGQKVTVGDHSDAKQKKLQVQEKALGDVNALLGNLSAGNWNELRIVVEGNHVQHFVNGKQVLDLVDEGHARFKDGVIALEGSSKGKLFVQYKEIKLKRLK